MSNLIDLLSYATPLLSMLAALITLVLAFKSGALKEFQLGALKIKASEKSVTEHVNMLQSVAASESGLQFETQQLAKYYGEVLAQSRLSFWFSLTFAVIGFLVIIYAAFSPSAVGQGASWLQVVSGVIIDAVAALFFVQSKRAQSSMAEFFDKLRLDRQHSDSQKMCDSIENTLIKDMLRAQLALYYAGLPDSHQVAQNMVSEWLPAHFRHLENKT